MEHIFSNCLSLKNIPDISRWNTSKLTQMNNMFFNCKSLNSIPNISNWNMSKVKIMIDYNKKFNSLEDNNINLIRDYYLGKYFFDLRLFCVCKIKGSECGLGIFIKIPIETGNKFVRVLFTSYNILNKEYLSKSNHIIIKYFNKILKLSKDKRRIWANYELNYSCIEIIDEDNINEFYSLDEDVQKNKFICLFGLIENKKPGILNGLILGTKEDNIHLIHFQNFTEYSILKCQVKMIMMNIQETYHSY